ncbi:MAG: hypothetical protein ACR2RA_08715, partial [Geminicoccaceae bacterium]
HPCCENLKGRSAASAHRDQRIGAMDFAALPALAFSMLLADTFLFRERNGQGALMESSNSNRLPQRILQFCDDMPRRERRLAELFLEEPRSIVEQSATQLAERADVSKATAARFSVGLVIRTQTSAEGGMRGGD